MRATPHLPAPRTFRNPEEPGAVLNLTRRRGWALLGLVAVLALVWLGLRALQLRDGLQAARAELVAASAEVAAGGATQLEQRRAVASEGVERARAATTDPLWRLASSVPLLGWPFEVAQDGVAAVDTVVDEVLVTAVKGLEVLEQRPVLSAGSIDLDVLADLSGLAVQAESGVGRAVNIIQGSPADLLPPPVQDARDELILQLAQLRDAVSTAGTALELAPPMLGRDGPRRYFLAVHNNAEARGTGGLVGAYAVLQVDGGTLSLGSVGTNQDFVSAAEPVIDLGAEFSEHWDWNDARSLWSSAVSTPDWPSAAAIMAALWREQGRGQVDGVVGIDPLVMEQVLAVTGPVGVGGVEVSSASVVDFVMRDEYAIFETDEQRKDVLAALAAELYQQVASGGYSGVALVQALARSAASGHLQVWSAVPAEQAVLDPLRVSGALPGTPGAFLMVSSYNAAGNKIDYYVRRRVGYVRDGEGGGRVTLELTNTVDPAAVPPIVTGRLDDPQYEVVPGQTRQLVSVYVGAGDRVERVFVDGAEMAARLGTEQGHGVASFYVEIRPDRPTVVEVDVTDQGGELLYRQQPLVVDDELAFDLPYSVG